MGDNKTDNNLKKEKTRNKQVKITTDKDEIEGLIREYLFLDTSENLGGMDDCIGKI